MPYVAVPVRIVALLAALAAALALAFFATGHLTGHSSAYLYRGVAPSVYGDRTVAMAKPDYLYRG